MHVSQFSNQLIGIWKAIKNTRNKSNYNQKNLHSLLIKYYNNILTFYKKRLSYCLVLQNKEFG